MMTESDRDSYPSVLPTFSAAVTVIERDGVGPGIGSKLGSEPAVEPGVEHSHGTRLTVDSPPRYRGGNS
jgi:hypothetical protein